MAPRKKVREPDIRRTFHSLSDDALIDDLQLADVASVAPSTVKRWRRERKLPEVVMICGRPRHRVGLIRPWLRGAI